MASQSDTKTVIETAVARVLEQVPALATPKLALVVALELQGRGDLQIYRVALPGPQVSKAIAPDAKITLSIPRAKFNELAEKGTLASWRTAFEHGEAKATGVIQYLQLIQRVVEAQEERNRAKRSRSH